MLTDVARVVGIPPSLKLVDVAKTMNVSTYLHFQIHALSNFVWLEKPLNAMQ